MSSYWAELEGGSETMSEVQPNTMLLDSYLKQLRLPIHPEGRVYGLPLVGSHVGADTAACLLAIALHQEDRNVALMDICTNTEIVCGNRKRQLSASCPAGRRNHAHVQRRKNAGDRGHLQRDG